MCQSDYQDNNTSCFLCKYEGNVSETPIGALLEVYTTLSATVRPAWLGWSQHRAGRARIGI